MYLQDYLVFLLAIGACMIFSAVASSKVNSTFAKYNRVRARSGYTGADVARHLMSLNGVHGVSVGRVGGKLTDHYHPAKAVVNLSDSTYAPVYTYAGVKYPLSAEFIDLLKNAAEAVFEN